MQQETSTIEEATAANPGWLDEAVDTREAARITSVPVATLETMRTRGGGPAFIKLGRSVRYLRRDLYAWLASHRCDGEAA